MLPIYKGKDFPSNQPKYSNMKGQAFVDPIQKQPAEQEKVQPTVHYGIEELIVFVLALVFAGQVSLNCGGNGFISQQFNRVGTGALCQRIKAVGVTVKSR